MPVYTSKYALEKVDVRIADIGKRSLRAFLVMRRKSSAQQLAVRVRHLPFRRDQVIDNSDSGRIDCLRPGPGNLVVPSKY
jgi:hypothetical protein